MQLSRARIAPALIAVTALTGAAAWGEGPVTVTATGECADANLATHVEAFSEALRRRLGSGLIEGAQLDQHIGLDTSKSAEELQRQLDAAQVLYYQADYGKAEAAALEALNDIQRLPGSAERWQLQSSAELVRALTYRSTTRPTDADEAFRRVLRVDTERQLDPDYYSPTIRKEFERVRAQVAQGKKAALSVNSTPAGATVYLDGHRVGVTPFKGRLIQGTYQVLIASGRESSFPHLATLKEDVHVQIDLAFEGAVHRRRVPCIDERGGGKARMANAAKLAALVGAGKVVMVRLDRQAGRSGWLAAVMLDAGSGQQVREGGLKLEDLAKPAEGLDDLANFVVTGQRTNRVVDPGPPAPVATAPSSTPQPVAAAPAQPPAPSADAPRAEKPAPTPVLVPSSEPSPVLVTTEDTSATRVAGYSLLGGGAVASGIAVALAVLASNSWGEVRTYLPANTPDRVALVKATQDRANGQQTGAWVAGGIGVLAIGTGVYLLFQ